jgi:hypothetical protein
MNSIGVDFKLKNIHVDNHNIKLQIVIISYISGTQQVRRDSERLQPAIIKELRL